MRGLTAEEYEVLCEQSNAPPDPDAPDEEVCSEYDLAIHDRLIARGLLVTMRVEGDAMEAEYDLPTPLGRLAMRIHEALRALEAA